MTSLATILEAVVGFVNSLGGFNVVVIALSAYVGKLIADRAIGMQSAKFANELEILRNGFLRETETHKIRLKKSEIMFQHELDASSSFVALFRGLHPIREWPDMDSDDAHSIIASKFPEIEAKLLEFLSRHGAILDNEVINNISECIEIAGVGKFGTDEIDMPRHSIQDASRIFAKLSQIESQLLANIRSQTCS